MTLWREGGWHDTCIDGCVKLAAPGGDSRVFLVRGPLCEHGPLQFLAGGGGGPWWRVVLTMTRTSWHLSTWASPKAVPA